MKAYTPTAADLADWMLRTARFDDKDRMAEEVAVQMPSPGEFDQLDVPEIAKVKRRTLLREIEDAPDVEHAKIVLVNMAMTLGPVLSTRELEFVQSWLVKAGAEPGWDPDFTARQIVDDAWRSGADIQFKQHLVEAWLRGRAL